MLRLCTVAVVIVVTSAQVKKPRESEATSSSSSGGSSGSARRRPPTAKSNAPTKDGYESQAKNRKAATGAGGGGGGGGLGLEVIIPIIVGVVAVMSGLAFFLYKRNAKSKDLLQQVAEEEERHKKEEEEKEKHRQEEKQRKSEELRNQKKEEAIAAKKKKIAPTQMLPAGWEQTSDPSSGKTYYFNRSTGESAWTPPTSSLAEAPAEDCSTITPTSRQGTEEVPEMTTIQDNTAAFMMSAPPVGPVHEATIYEGGGPMLDRSAREDCKCICNAV